jgi:SAM-dependent methyltransferase
MSSSTLDFHRGLAARLFELFNTEDAPDVSYYRHLVERGQGPALDVGCGSGRLLLNYLRAGLEVDGTDISPDMLSRCRAAAERENLAPNLYQQSMSQLNFPRRYRTIFACGAFGLNGTRADDIAALDRFHERLEEGGTLAVDIEAGWSRSDTWNRCSEQDLRLPTEWTEGWSTPTPEGDSIGVKSRIVALDPLEQTFTKELMYELVHADEVVSSEVHVLIERWYGKNEMVAMLERAGFELEAIHGDYKHEPVDGDHRMHVYVARKTERAT